MKIQILIQADGTYKFVAWYEDGDSYKSMFSYKTVAETEKAAHRWVASRFSTERGVVVKELIL